MTSPVLRVVPADLRQLAQRCAMLAGQVAPQLPTLPASAWQTSSAACNTTNTGAGTAAAAMRARLTANATKLTTTADEYEATDNNAAAALTAVAQRAGGPPPLAPHSGVDAGAGALGTGR
ncbi:type VII secretion target [Mycolicibacter hiberniae]|uniref:Uncharacterized protein n=1 Tax=Mycolicibacter hiberniae TaxID=29314 RepID=A0A7I7WXS1_9MYCO|nr:type VII secretion target [Mycolicibacter hiberniae]MCV7084985.1 hypothetical protein [Mycolicibacter hiberniae]ORV73102.1 hypothetical protein AWC09_02635 [Mycolicibacter hiberniae]BBZ22366.1 hypothetical protein MHIB_07840 [Mycolicibacter hiberniae]